MQIAKLKNKYIESNEKINMRKIFAEAVSEWKKLNSDRKIISPKSRTRGERRMKREKLIEKMDGRPSSQGWTVYGEEWCGFCKRAVELLKSRNSKFVYYDKTGSTFQKLARNMGIKERNPKESAEKAFKKTIGKMIGNHRTIPIVFHNGKFIGGYSDLENMILRSS